MKSVALMYHGISSAQHPPSAMPAEDLPYALEEQAFSRHLKCIGAAPVLLTFDDGDAGWYYSALPLLEKAGLRALFFVTPALIGTPGYCSWEQLHALVEAGHQVGSHGMTHRFLPDLDEQDCLQELSASKQEIEKRLGISVESVSFPGGRYGARELAFARRAGYRQCYSSVPGRLQEKAFCQPRVAVRAQTSEAWLVQLLQGHWRVWLALRGSYLVKATLKKLLGNRGYHALYRIARG
jgi:peptidoglycan/xylan/chitin deacetylase (PgdA/CDA1 family)